MPHPPESEPPAPLSAPYSRYAAVYDRIGQRAFGERIASATLTYLGARGVTPRCALDLACGTGAAAGWFARAGLDVTAVDRCPEMIEQAARALHELGVSVKLIVGDMREHTWGERFDLVTCFYDAINYLQEESDIERTFARAYGALAPGGFFVFDVNTRTKFASSWNDTCYVAADDGAIFGVYRGWFEPATGFSPLVLTFFERDAGSGLWRRFDEEHVERAYPLETIARLLTNAGFQIDDLRDYADHSPALGGPGNERSHRVVFIARKPAQEEPA